MPDPSSPRTVRPKAEAFLLTLLARVDARNPRALTRRTRERPRPAGSARDAKILGRSGSAGRTRLSGNAPR